MAKTLQLFEMGFSENEISSAVDKLGNCESRSFVNCETVILGLQSCLWKAHTFRTMRWICWNAACI